MITQVTKDSFKSEVLQAKTLVLVDFYAPWCGPCKKFAPILEEISQKFDGKLKVVKIDIDEEEALAVKYGITNIPTSIFYKDGKTVAAVIGFRSLDEVEKIVERHI